jgi:hypothetical protein
LVFSVWTTKTNAAHEREASGTKRGTRVLHWQQPRTLFGFSGQQESVLSDRLA